MPHRFDLPEEFNVNNAYDTLEKLRHWLSESAVDIETTLDMHAHSVMEIDGTGMQLLAALSKSGYRWRICEPSTKFSSICRTLGLDDWLVNVVAPTAEQGVAP